MKRSATPRRKVPRPRRTASAVGALLVLALPFGFLAAQAVSTAGSRGAAARDERAGVAYLRPLTGLLTALTRAQSTAVQGKTPDRAAVGSAVAAVDAADAADGARLATHARWADLRQRVVRLTSQRETGQRAFADYSDTIDLALALVGAVGTGAGLTLDPGADSALLVDAVLVRLPALVVDSGRMADLAVEGGQSTGAARSDLTAQILTARDRVSTTAAALDSDLETDFDSSADPDLAAVLASPVDRLRDVVSTVAPPTPLVDLVATLADAGQIASSRVALDSAAGQVDSGLLAGLDARLRTRVRDQQELRAAGLVAVAVGVLAAGWLLWTLPPSERRRRPAVAAAAEAAAVPAVPAGSVASPVRGGGLGAR